MTAPGPHDPDPSLPASDAHWREFLDNPDSLLFIRRIFGGIPSKPRCHLCASPFGGFGGPVMRLIGKAQSAGNPNLCTSCERRLMKSRGGAEVVASLLFADIRGSTALAERISATEFRATLDRYYTVAASVVYDHGGIVDKFVGDELVANFPPFLGTDHARRAIDAGLDLLRATGHADADGPWVPIGAAVATGPMWFGAIGEGHHVEITVVGDVVNTTARLTAAAAEGEVLVSADAAAAAGLGGSGERRSLALRGKEAMTEVVVVKATRLPEAGRPGGPGQS